MFGRSDRGALVAWPGDLPGLPRSRRHDAHAARGGGGDAALPHRALRQPQRLARRVPGRPARAWTRPATSSPRPSAARRVRSCSRAAGPRPTTWPSSARSGATAAWPCARPPSTTPCCTRSSTWVAGSWPSTRPARSTSTCWPTPARRVGPRRVGHGRQQRGRDDLPAGRGGRRRARAGPGRGAPHRRRAGPPVARPGRRGRGLRPGRGVGPQVRRPEGGRCPPGAGQHRPSSRS